MCHQSSSVSPRPSRQPEPGEDQLPPQPALCRLIHALDSSGLADAAESASLRPQFTPILSSVGLTTCNHHGVPVPLKSPFHPSPLPLPILPTLPCYNAPSSNLPWSLTPPATVITHNSPPMPPPSSPAPSSPPRSDWISTAKLPHLPRPSQPSRPPES